MKKIHNVASCKSELLYKTSENLAPDAWPTVSADVKSIVLDNNKVQYLEFPEPDYEGVYPGPYSIPEELLKFKPCESSLFRYFDDTHSPTKKTEIRQIFFHVKLSFLEKKWVTEIKEYCRWKNFPLKECLDPFLLRILLFCWRKNGENHYIVKAYEHILELLNWRSTFLPVNPTERLIQYNFRAGAIYWTARDVHLRPLLVIRMKRIMSEKPSSIELKRLIVYYFEWGLRFLFVPGLVETCSVIFDVREVSIRSLPVSSVSEMIHMLTRQYPFRLDKMFILNDSIFIQTIWNIAKGFLTEIQQQKMIFMRSNHGAQLLKLYAPHHLEVDFGGTRPMIKQFEPSPLLPGPFEPYAKGPNLDAVKDCHKAIDKNTVKGKMWLDGKEEPINWAPEAINVFKKANIPPPFSTIEEATVGENTNEIIIEPLTRQGCTAQQNDIIQSFVDKKLQNRSKSHYHISNVPQSPIVHRSLTRVSLPANKAKICISDLELCFNSSKSIILPCKTVSIKSETSRKNIADLYLLPQSSDNSNKALHCLTLMSNKSSHLNSVVTSSSQPVEKVLPRKKCTLFTSKFWRRKKKIIV